jgi:DNA polymerase (family 10)
LRPEAVIPGKSAFDPLVRRCAAAIRILKGIESDILVDGSLDYPDDVLDRFDFDPRGSPALPIQALHGFTGPPGD